MIYVVKIKDKAGTSCRMRLSIPFLSLTTKPKNSAWRVLTEGVLRYRKGKCDAHKPIGFAATDIRLLAEGKPIIRLRAMFDALGFVNSSGTGKVMQSAVASLQPGEFKWVLID